MFGEENNTTVIHNAIELGKFRYNEEKRKLLREKYGIESDTIVIGFVGRIQYQKNPIFLIKIFEEFYKMNHGSRLVLVGTGVMEDECKALVRKNSLEDKVLFLGMQKETADYYSMFDAFLFPSLFEGLGVVLVEAQANIFRFFKKKE